MPLLTLKSANRLKTSYGYTFEKLLDFLDQKYHLQETFATKRKNLFKRTKPLTLNEKTKLVPLLTLKRANEFKTSYDNTFNKVFDLFDQKYHFLETFDTKTQKLV